MDSIREMKRERVLCRGGEEKMVAFGEETTACAGVMRVARWGGELR